MKIPVKAKVYTVTNGQTALKCLANVDIGDVIHINSYSLSNTTDNPDRIYAFPPSYRMKNGKYKPYIEFPDARTNPLLNTIYKACLSAYKHYENTYRLHEYGETYFANLDDPSTDSPDSRGIEEIIHDSNLDEEIKLSDLPF